MKAVLAGFFVLAVIGCVGQTVKPITEISKERIVYRDLTQHWPIVDPDDKTHENRGYREKFDEKTKGQKKPETGSEAHQKLKPEYFIGFANDSATRFDQVEADKVIGSEERSNQILIIGHSHGKSSVGTLQLASKRAQTIAGYLKGKGFEHVHVMASWGNDPVWFAPGRGVHLYVLPRMSGVEKEAIPIVFAKTIPPKKKNHDLYIQDALNTAQTDLHVRPGGV